MIHPPSLILGAVIGLPSEEFVVGVIFGAVVMLTAIVFWSLWHVDRKSGQR